jgi:HAD superfamily hydrolase (TIGR01509 family)
MNSVQYKGAIFDMDGTLLDSMSIWETAGATYLKTFGITPNSDWREITRPMCMAQISTYFKDCYHLDVSYKEVADGMNQIVEDFYKKEAVVKPGVLSYLQKLKDSGCHICVATATDRYLAEIALQKNGIMPYLDRIFTCSEVGHGKDEPIIYQECAAYWGLKLSECCVYEDALYALQTAHDAGFPTIAVYDDSAKMQESVKKTICDRYILDFNELL